MLDNSMESNGMSRRIVLSRSSIARLVNLERIATGSEITVSPRKRNMYRQINLAEWNVKWGERSIGEGERRRS